MGKKKIFLIICMLWIVIFGGLIAFKEFTLQTGNEILLKTQPIDPRDLFRGDYVILRYDISTVSTDSLSYQSSDFKEDDTVYVLLNVNEDNIGTLSDIDKNKPKEGMFIEGTVKRVYNNSLNIEYGIESYFVPEGKGKEIEKNLGKIYTKVAVDDFGNAVITSLVLEDKDIDLN